MPGKQKLKSAEAEKDTRTAGRSAKRKPLRDRPYATYIHRVFDQMNPENNISTKAMKVTESLLNDILEKLCRNMTDLAKIKKDQRRLKHATEPPRKVLIGKQLSLREVLTAIKLTFPQEFARDLIQIANEVADKYRDKILTKN